jgi:hypothetical protein
MTKLKLINTILLFAVLSGNAVADEIFSKAIYDSKLKTLSLEGVLVPFIDEFTGKETDNKGIFDVQLEEKTKLVFELIPWSITNKNMFDGENTSGYILYDSKTRSVNIPCFQVTTIAKFGDGIEGESIYYKDVNMKQRHVAYPIFHVEDMTETDNCENSVIPEPEEPPQKPTLTTTPTTTEDDTVEVEVNGEDGTTVFVNGVDSGKTIDSTGKVKVTLDTSGEAGDKNFSITLKDDAGNESEALTFVITKQQAITLTYTEQFNNFSSGSGDWTSAGSPLPKRLSVSDAEDGYVWDSNGDGSYHSGSYLNKFRLPWNKEFKVEFRLKQPVATSRNYWLYTYLSIKTTPFLSDRNTGRNEAFILISGGNQNASDRLNEITSDIAGDAKPARIESNYNDGDWHIYTIHHKITATGEREIDILIDGSSFHKESNADYVKNEDFYVVIEGRSYTYDNYLDYVKIYMAN